MHLAVNTSTSVLIVGPICTPTASHAASWLSNHGEYADGRDGQTDGRQAVTLRILLDAISVTTYDMHINKVVITC